VGGSFVKPMGRKEKRVGPVFSMSFSPSFLITTKQLRDSNFFSFKYQDRRKRKESPLTTSQFAYHKRREGQKQVEWSAHKMKSNNQNI
jgi:hypothetical protein